MKNSKGISLISLSITILLMIIIASIAVFNGFKASESAEFTRFISEIEQLEIAVSKDYAKISIELTKDGEFMDDDEIFYYIATGSKVDEVPSEYALPIEDFDMELNSDLRGDTCYVITPNIEINGELHNKTYVSSSEVHYITNKGEVFIYPGFDKEDNGEMRYYINNKKYYTGDSVVVLGGNAK